MHREVIVQDSINVISNRKNSSKEKIGRREEYLKK